MTRINASLSNAGLSCDNIELLMDMATTLADYTHSPELCRRIPAYLSATLDIGPVTLGVIRHGETGQGPTVEFLATSLKGEETEGESFKHSVLEAFRAAEDTGVGDFGECGIETGELLTKVFVMARKIDENTGMVLVVHASEKGNNALEIDSPSRGMTEEVQEALGMVAGQLSKLLKWMMLCQEQPALLGEPFDRLTEREWRVLRALNSEDGEKQLADRLSLSPHTLHSHIKSIYRKVGVQGRLPLLLRLQEAMRNLRLTTAGVGTTRLLCV